MNAFLICCEQHMLQQHCIRGGPSIFDDTTLTTHDQQQLPFAFQGLLDRCEGLSSVWAVFFSTLPRCVRKTMWHYITTHSSLRFLVPETCSHDFRDALDSPLYYSVPNVTVDVNLNQLGPAPTQLVDYTLVCDFTNHDSDMIWVLEDLSRINQWCQSALSMLLSFESAWTLLSAFEEKAVRWSNPSEVDFHHMDESQIATFLNNISWDCPLKILRWYPNVHLEDDFATLLLTMPLSCPAFQHLFHVTIGAELSVADWKCLLLHAPIPSIEVCYHRERPDTIVVMWQNGLIPFLTASFANGDTLAFSRWRHLILNLEHFDFSAYFPGYARMVWILLLSTIGSHQWSLDTLILRLPESCPDLNAKNHLETTGFQRAIVRYGPRVQEWSRSIEEATLSKKKIREKICRPYWNRMGEVMKKSKYWNRLPSTIQQEVFDFLL